MNVLDSHRVVASGSPHHQPILFGHGYGTDQSMWRFLAPLFVDTHRVVVFDYRGHGDATRDGLDDDRYTALDRYASDVLEICHALNLRDVVFVGHSVSGIIGVLAANAEPDRFAGLVLIGSSPRFLNDVGYVGGYTRADIAGLIDNIDSNLLNWAVSAAPDLIGEPGQEELSDDVARRLARTDHRMARQFARATFLSDHRADVAKVSVPTLVLHCSADTVVPPVVGEYLAGHIPHSRYESINATGHFPHLSAPDQISTAVFDFLPTLAGRR
jgi:sigma-B regulation protein RsbQ